MPTSGTGTWTDRSSPSRRGRSTGPQGFTRCCESLLTCHKARRGGSTAPPGFTLIEILVVLIIVGVVLSAAMLSLRGDRRADILREEAERLLALTRLAREEAVMRGEEIGLRVEGDQYLFLARRENRWAPIEGEGVFRPRAIPPELTLRLEVEGVEVAASGSGDRRGGAKGLPHIALWSSGELTPFQAILRLADGGEGYTLEGRASGTLTLKRLNGK